MSHVLALRVGLIAAASALVLAGCAPAPEATDGPDSDFCARMVTNSGGLNDRSFNDASWKGLQEAEKKYGIKAEVLVSTGPTDLDPNVQQAVDSGCGFILTVGWELAEATATQAEANPDIDFSIVDEVVDAPNVKSIVFDTAQAAYLAGYAAAGVTQTGIVGTFGGDNQPPVTLFMDGFADGIAKYNEVHGTSVQLLGWDKATQDGLFTGDYEDINKGQVTAQGLIDQGADVILPVAGQVGEGAASAALDSGKALIIWVDSDGYDVLPEEYRSILLTSIMKNTGDAVLEIAHSAQTGDFDNSSYIGTLENGGVAIAPFHDLSSRVSAELQGELDQLKADIISGAIVVESASTPK